MDRGAASTKAMQAHTGAGTKAEAVEKKLRIMSLVSGQNGGEVWLRLYM